MTRVVRVLVLVATLAIAGVTLSATVAGAEPSSPVGTWDGRITCETGTCAGQVITGTFSITSWDQATNAIAGTDDTGSAFSGAYDGSNITITAVEPNQQSAVVARITTDGNGFIGHWDFSTTGTSPSKAGGPASYRRKGAPPIDPRGSWSGTTACETGYCKGISFPNSFVVQTWDQARGQVTGLDADNSPFTATYDGTTFTLAESAGTATLLMRADGNELKGPFAFNGGAGGVTGVAVADRVGAATAPVPVAITAGATTTVPTTVPTTVATTVPVTTIAPSTTTIARPPSTLASTGPATTIVPATTSTTTIVAAAPAPPPGPERSTFLDIPSPSEAITLKNVALAGVLSIFLLLLVVFPSTLFNNTLEANIDEVRRWLPAVLRPRPAPTDGAPEATRSFWHSWAGFATYLLAADALYSLMQPGWGLNRGTAHTFLGFLLGATVSTFTGITITRSYLKRYGPVGGHIEVEAGTLAFAVVCVVASRLAHFVPGYFYGVIALYVPTVTPSAEDAGRIKARAVAVTYVLAITGWLLFTPLQRLAAHGGFFGQTPLALSGGLVTGAVEFIVIGLIPLRFLPGHVLKRWNPTVWVVSYFGGGFLFTLLLLHPGLVGAHEASVVWTIALAVFFAVGSLAFWAYFRQRALAPATGAEPEPAPEPEPT